MSQFDMFALTTPAPAAPAASIEVAKQVPDQTHRPDRWWPSNDPAREVAVCLGCSVAFHRRYGSEQLEYLSSFSEGYRPAGPCRPTRRFGPLAHKETLS